MVFSSVEFLFLFLPLTIAAYFLTPNRWRNITLILASIFFYAWGAEEFIFIMLASTLVDWALARLIEADKERGDLVSARRLMYASVVQNLAVLGYYKYAGFFVREVSESLSNLGLGSPEALSILLPIGVSFFTFEKISYTVDVWRGDVKARRNPLDVVLFVVLFPRAIAGPIVRLREIEPQLTNRRVGLDDLTEGATRFAYGLAKKVLIADSVAPVANAAFDTQGQDLTTTAAWIGVIAFTIQIYFDFSGYSDMAIGIGRMLGFRLPENFDRPYSAISLTDFWRRWHMTLSRWFRDYVYIPLGGSKGSSRSTYRNLILTFLLTGFWHGAEWTFVIWGAYHGAFMLVERATHQRPVGDGRVNLVVLRRAVTLLIVIVGWVLFRADSMSAALDILQAMFTPSGAEIDPRVRDVLTNQALLAGLIGVSVFFLPRTATIGRLVAAGRTRLTATARVAVVGVVLPVALVLVISGTFSPFLYFRF